MFNGNDRRANKLFSASLEAPTDNSLAQVVWASKRTGLGEVNPKLLTLPHTSEAKTFDAHNHRCWSDVVAHARNWVADEPFSARPRQLASAVAASLLDNPALSEQIAHDGLATNPGNPGLINNVAFALVEQGKCNEALDFIAQADRQNITPVELICLTATSGLALFRSGDPTEGASCTKPLSRPAAREKDETLKTLARLYYARERVFQGEPDGLKEFRKAHEDAKKLQRTSVPDVAENLAKQIMDHEVRFQPA